MIRDYSESALNSVTAQIDNQMSVEFQSAFIFDSAGYDHWIYKLGLGDNLAAPAKFNDDLLEKNAHANSAMKTLYKGVQAADSAYGSQLAQCADALDAIKSYSQTLGGSISGSGISISPFSLYFAAGRMGRAYNDFLSSVTRFQFYHMVNGEWQVDQDALLEALALDVSQVSQAEMEEILSAWMKILPSKPIITDAKSLFSETYIDSMLMALGFEQKKSSTIFGKDSTAFFLLRCLTEDTTMDFLKLQFESKGSVKSKFNIKKWGDFVNEKLEDKGWRTKVDRKEEYFDKDGNTVRGDDIPAFKKKLFDIAEVKGQVGARVSVFDYKDKNFLGGELGITVGEAEAHGSVSAGFYVYDQNGQKVFSPGVAAEIGASATLLNITYENQLLGDKNFGLNVDGGVTVGQVSAKAGANASFLGKDKDGKLVFDPQANISVGAEAIAAKVEGSAGVNILGGEVGVKGSLQVGVGAKADIGYKDGVFKCEIGASLGIGFDIGIEVDVGGMVDTAVSWLKDLF